MTAHHAARRAVALLAVVVLSVVAAFTLTTGPAVANTASLPGTRVAASPYRHPTGSHAPNHGVDDESAPSGSLGCPTRLRLLEVPGMMYSMAYRSSSAVVHMSTTELREAAGPKLVALLDANAVIEVGPYGRSRTAVVVAPQRYDELEEAFEEMHELKERLLPMFQAAAREQLTLPSELYLLLTKSAGLELNSDWRALTRFLAENPVATTRDEDGNPIATARLTTSYVGELDEDLE